MTRVSCPECGYNLDIGKLDEGDLTTLICDNCSSEFLVSIREGEIRTNNTMEYSYGESSYGESSYGALEEEADY